MRSANAAKTALPPDSTRALVYLLEAHQLADELKQPKLNFACQLQCLLQAGLTETGLRRLMLNGAIEHLVETTAPGMVTRTFERTSSMRFQEQSCFLLTPGGLTLARTRVDGPAGLRARHTLRPAQPHYDAGRRILYLGSKVVKEYKVPARNQELILLAFEEDGWPVHLSDPLPGEAHVDAKGRLNDTIRNLNSHHQTQGLLIFRGDGTGNGVLWRACGRSSVHHR